MCTLLCDLALIEDDNPISSANSRQTVGNHKGRAILHQLVQGRLHQLFALRIESACCFIKQQDRRIAKQRTGNRDTLALAA